MKKITKKIVAMGAAVMMMVSMSSIGASAACTGSWNLKFALPPGAPSNTIPMSGSYRTQYLTTITTNNYFQSTCTLHYSPTDSDGYPAYAQYYCAVYNDKKILKGVTKYQYHYQEGAVDRVTLPEKQEYGMYSRVTYALKQKNKVGMDFTIKGTYKLS